MATPIDPYANAGAEQNIDRQKALLNDIIATQGQAGRQVYERQAPEAQAALQQQLASAPATPQARQDVFGAYIKDAQLAEQGQADFMKRQTLLNSNFLDQAKAAVPIHAADVKNQQEALRMQYEDAQAARAAARAGSGGGYSGNPLIKNEQQKAEYLQYLKDNNLIGDPSELNLSDLQQLGIAGSASTPEAVAQQLGINWKAVQGKLADPADVSVLKSQIDKWARSTKGAFGFHDLQSQINAEGSALGVPPIAIQLLLASYAPQWGINPRTALDPTSWGNPYEQQSYQLHGAATQQSVIQPPKAPVAENPWANYGSSKAR